ncbi:MAG: response regulator [bacterium]
MENTKVLIVDDEIDFVDTLAERMRNRGLVVDTAFSGQEALEFVTSKAYHAIVLDLAMPGMDGIETLKRMLSLNADLQVILLTGRATVDKGIEAMRSGAFEFLEKPVKIDTLITRIDDAKSRKTALTEAKMDDMVEKIVKRKGW